MKVTGLGAIIEGLDNGISTDINQFGLPLSQGNRVTLAIARAVISEPKILLLDEALTSLDKASRLNFLTNMNNIINQQTLIMATHDLRLLPYFDKVLVLKDGQVAGFGEHDVLITECDTYKELWSLENDLANVSLPPA